MTSDRLDQDSATRRGGGHVVVGESDDQGVAAIPDSTKSSLRQRLVAHAREHWPAISDLQFRYRAGFAYLDAVMPDGEIQPLCRLRYAGSARMWGFAMYRASHDDYEDSFLPTGFSGGTAEDALDTAAGLYLTARDQPPTNLRA